MARKESLERGNDNYTMLIDLILNLTPKQVKLLYTELKSRYSGRAMTKVYNELGEIDKENGKVRLTEHQYKTLRVKYGDTYMNKALHVMSEYIRFLELHQDESKWRSKLQTLKARTHCKELEFGGWVYDKCKSYICKQEDISNISINPFTIDDISVAKKYIEALPLSMRKQPDVIWLIEKFPELNNLLEEE